MFKKENIKANWQLFERRPTWSVVTSAELAQVLNVHLQTINNWKTRGHLPAPVIDLKLKGNQNRFRISVIKSWLENRPESDIHWEWIRKYIPYDINTLEEAQYVANQAYKFIGIERPLIRLPV